MKFKDMVYTRPNIAEYQAAFEGLIGELQAAGSADEAWAVHQRFYELTGHLQTASELVMIRHDINTVDPQYNEEKGFMDENSPLIQNMIVAYQRALYESPYRKDLESRIGAVAFRNIELAMESVDERILPLMQEENALTTRYNNILASAQIPFDGKVCNLSLMSPYLHGTDRGVRKAAWEAMTGFFLENQEEIDDIYDQLVRNRTRQGEEMGHENYLPLGYARMMRNSYTRSDVAEFRKQVKEDLVPFAEELHERRRRRLGIDHLYYYDEGVYFPQGNPGVIGGPAEILAAGRQMYRELSPETGAFMDFMCDGDLFDVEGRPNKTTGGYMTYIPDYKSPFIFANFNGTTGDADVITHECGHAFQGWLTSTDPIREHADITMETAETHSMSMEFFTEPWMNLLFGARAKDYVDMHFEDAITFIPYGTMVDEFQDIVYANPGLTPAQRDGVWRDLERQYKPHLDYTGNAYYEAGGFWQKQHHIYDSPLYYIDYCIAGTNALQYKVWMDRDYKGAWESYLQLCRLSASDYFPRMIDAVGLANPFEDGCLRYVVKQLREKI